MFLHFPRLDTLYLALTSAAIPESIRSTSVRFAAADDQSIWIESAETFTEKIQKSLRRLGIGIPSRCDVSLNQSALHWLQVIPLSLDTGSLDFGDKTPILFELNHDRQLADLALEMLRLGNDRQSFRWLEGEGKTRGLLRVVGPPYYSLLQALDRERQAGAPLAYREAAPRVWIQLGYAHPLADHLHSPAGQWLLISSPRDWCYVPEGKLNDIYEVIEFQLPDQPQSWQSVTLPASIKAPVRLARSGSSDAAELWILREVGIAQLEELVRTSDDELLGRLAFAVGERNGERIVVLRVRPSKSAPPVLVLDGVACRSYLRIPNLFLPIDMALQPPLRRETVIQLLAADRNRVVWTMPREQGSFTPESLPEDAFRPLRDWVEYVLEHDQAPITAWLAASQFQFEGFICKDDAKKKPSREPTASKEPNQGKPREPKQATEMLAETVSRPTKPKPTSTERETRVTPRELEHRLRELEAAYMALPASPEDPQRQSLWHEMARLNAMLNQPSDAAICWGNAVWELSEIPREHAAEWSRLEANRPITLTNIGRIVQRSDTTHAEVRQVAAFVISAGATAKPPAELPMHLIPIQQYLQKHENYLGLRVAWLAWSALDRLAGSDVLMLARARDRLLERLHLHGIAPELDLPGFLRFTGLQASQRFRMVRDQVIRLHRQVQDWAKTGTHPVPETHAYIDLVFAFGLARLGETGEARNLLNGAAAKLAVADEVHSWLYSAFEVRIQQAFDGKPALERLPEALLAQLAAIEHPDSLDNIHSTTEREKAKQSQRLLRLRIDRMREKSRILEPHERLVAYDRWLANSDVLTREFTGLSDITDRDILTDRLHNLLKGKQKFEGVANPGYRILAGALNLAPRLGQAFGEELLDRVPIQIAKMKNAEEIADLLDKSLFVAAHFDRKDDVQRFVAQLDQLLRTMADLSLAKLIPLISRSFRSLRKFGLREAVAGLIDRLARLVEKDLTSAAGAKSLPGDRRSKQHCLLLALAGNWYYFGDESRANKIIDDARTVLLQNDLGYVAQTELACAYLAALGEAPMEFALGRMMEFFRKVEGIHDLWYTADHFSLTRLMVVEAMMLALISDDFTLDRAARQRLDDDEYLIRRRIHRDVRRAMAPEAQEKRP